MQFEIKNAIIQRDNLDENFNLIDPKGQFKDKTVLAAVDGDTLITLQLLIAAILKNDFKKWRKIAKDVDFDSISQILPKLGYSRENLSSLLSEL